MQLAGDNGLKIRTVWVRVPPQLPILKGEILKSLLFFFLVLNLNLAIGQRLPTRNKIFIKSDSDFSVSITAALNKKDAPVIIVLDEKNADYILQTSNVNVEHESGLSKIARCAFASCVGIGGSTNVSAQLIDKTNNSVVWAYQVKKGNAGSHGEQSMSEAIAKHLKNEFFKHHN